MGQLLWAALAVAVVVVSGLPLDTGSPSGMEDVELLDAGTTNSTGNSSAPAAASNATAAPPPAQAAKKSAGSQPVVKKTAMPKEPSPKDGMHQAKIQAYVAKIKQFQKLKNQKWDPDVEQDLAEKLVMVDSMMDESDEEKEIEKKLRSGNVKGMNVEMSLRKQAQAKIDKAKEDKADLGAKLKEVRQKKRASRRMMREERKIQRTIRKYKRLSVPKELKSKHIKAKIEYAKAHKMEEMAKKSKHYVEFAKEYGVDKPAEKEADYPQAGAQPAPAQQSTAPAQQSPSPALGETSSVHNSEDDHIIMGHLPEREYKDTADLGLDEPQVDTEDDNDNSANEVKTMDAELSQSALASMQSVDRLLAQPVGR